MGQYTGLKDKNGKRIFEGDVCVFKDAYLIAFEETADIIAEVKFLSASFYYINKSGCTDLVGEGSTHWVKIGNIHEDNPELIKES